jgi:hypothetical protein
VAAMRVKQQTAHGCWKCCKMMWLGCGCRCVWFVVFCCRACGLLMHYNGALLLRLFPDTLLSE